MMETLLSLTGLSAILTAIGIIVAGLAFYKQAVSIHAASRSIIFLDQEEGQEENIELNSTTKKWLALDISSRVPVLMAIASAGFWLVLGSIAGLLASWKLHSPDLLNQTAELTFGRMRTLHLNLVAYGWLSLGGIGVVIWLMPRLLRERLPHFRSIFSGVLLWNLSLTFGAAAIVSGYAEGVEWLEMPLVADLGLTLAGALIMVPVVKAVIRSKIPHLYVSAWYFIAALLWFPILFFIGNLPNLHHGVEHALANWWFAHNALGLWFTPLSLGIAYYIIPKAVGSPVYSYNLSFLGFWTLALFYSNVGVHHLIGGPVPQWVATVSVVMSMLMLIPVFSVAINHHMTAFRHRSKLLHSWPLRFVVLGCIFYTIASVQGSLHSLRSLSRITHFTHYTVSHAHLGAYGFVSFILFGAVYFVLPKVLQMKWLYPRLIKLHFYLVLSGILIYVISLGIGGWLQGLAMLDPEQSFRDSVIITKPYLMGRTLGGTLMTLGHFVFAIHGFLTMRAYFKLGGQTQA